MNEDFDLLIKTNELLNAEGVIRAFIDSKDLELTNEVNIPLIVSVYELPSLIKGTISKEISIVIDGSI